MRTLILAICLIFASSFALADVYVDGYYRSNGTYVQPHYRSNPDGNPYNNWSSKGNQNPYTGQYGTKDPGFYYDNNNPSYKYQPVLKPINNYGLNDL